LPGLNSSGVTLEFGGLWDPTVPAAVPPATGAVHPAAQPGGQHR
jgi:hypothetical protein